MSPSILPSEPCCHADRTTGRDPLAPPSLDRNVARPPARESACPSWGRAAERARAGIMAVSHDRWSRGPW